MTRPPVLNDLSHDHHDALLHARFVRLAARDDPGAPPFPTACDQLLSFWRDVLQDHFDEEEGNLVPHLEAAGAEGLHARLVGDHEFLRVAFDDLGRGELPNRWVEVAGALHDHIRWEENTLFPWVEDHLSEGELATLGRRSETSPGRIRGAATVTAGARIPPSAR